MCIYVYFFLANAEVIHMAINLIEKKILFICGLSVLSNIYGQRYIENDNLHRITQNIVLFYFIRLSLGYATHPIK